ncbi:MAG: hypothetical protein AB7D57_09570 [Desulfovibrionaceae bacterium]
MGTHRQGQAQALQSVVRALGELAEEFVFVGGAVAGLLMTDSAVSDVRYTLDLDVIVRVATRVEFYGLQERLRAKGFREDAEGGVICRWRRDDIVLDVMPTDAGVLGFSNRWYADAVAAAETCRLEDGTRLRHVNGVFFLATKLEALHGRGEGRYMESRDMEDIVALLDGRETIVEEVAASKADVRRYLAGEMSRLMEHDRKYGLLSGHLPGDAASQQRIPIILERMRSIAAQG